MHTAFKNDKIIICVKPAGMPSQPDPSKDTDMMTAASDYLKVWERAEIYGLYTDSTELSADL